MFATWGFIPTEELAGGHCSRVYADATRVVKVPWRGEELTSGYRAAWMLSGHRAPKVFAGDEASGVVLMERILPGTSLAASDVHEDEAFQIIRGLIRELSGLDSAGFPSLGEYFSQNEPLSRWMVESSGPPVFLHGDLHHENVLLGPNGWVMIDPKGLAGDRAFEAAAFVRNPPGFGDLPDLESRLARRIKRWAQALESEPWRIWGWALAALREDPFDPHTSWGRVRLALERIWPPEVPRL